MIVVVVLVVVVVVVIVVVVVVLVVVVIVVVVVLVVVVVAVLVVVGCLSVGCWLLLVMFNSGQIIMRPCYASNKSGVTNQPQTQSWAKSATLIVFCSNSDGHHYNFCCC